MLKRLRLLLPVLFLSGLSFGQIVNPPSGGGTGGGNVYNNKPNTFTSASINDFTAATLILPNGASNPTGACTNAAAVFTNNTTGAQFSCIGGVWVSTNTSFAALSGDVTSTSAGVVTVQALRGVSVSSTTPLANQFFGYNGSSWIAMSLPSLTGDVTGPIGANVVSKIRGVPVSTTAPTTNQVLSFDGAQYSPTTLTPVTSVTMGGDVTGPSGASKVVKIQGNAVSSNAPADGQMITWSAANSEWEPKTFALPTNYSLSGDVIGTTDINTVAKIRGITVSTTSPLAGQILTFDGTQYAPANAPVDTSGNSSIPGTSDTSTEDSPYGFLGTGSNFLTYSVSIGGTNWTLNSGATVSLSGTTGPDGTTASSLIASSTTAGNNISQSFTTTSAGAYTFSVWAKQGASPLITIDFKSGTTVLQAKTVTLSSTGNGWQRIYVASPALTAATAYTVDIYPGGNTSTSASNTNYVWGAQVNPGSGPIGFVKTFAASLTAPLNGVVTDIAGLSMIGSASGLVTIQPQAVAGNINFVLPNTVPSQGQNMVVASVSGNSTTLGWTTSTHRVSWELGDPSNVLTTTTGAAPNVAVNTSATPWNLQAVYCISDDSATTTFQLTTGGVNIGPAGGMSCSSTILGYVAASLNTTSVASNATVSQTITTPSANLHHITVVLVYQ